MSKEKLSSNKTSSELERDHSKTTRKSKRSTRGVHKTRRSVVKIDRTEVLKAAIEELQRVQSELLTQEGSTTDHGIDYTQLGFLTCAEETFAFLRSQGISDDDPVFVSIKNALINKMNSITA